MILKAGVSDMKQSEKMIIELIEKKQEMHQIFMRMQELEGGLNGMEIEYEGKSGIVDCVDGNQQTANLYLQDEYGNESIEKVSLATLLKIIQS